MRMNMRMVRRVLSSGIFYMLMLSFASSIAAEPELPAKLPAKVPEYVTAALPEATLIGGAPMRWFGLKIYDARLWANKKTLQANTWSSQPLMLELVYARQLAGEKIALRSIEEMKHLGIGSPSQHASWLEAMKRIFPNVESGMQLTGLYQPGQATRFYRNGTQIGEISDPDFGPAFFAIWLHPRSSAPELRAALLGLK